MKRRENSVEMLRALSLARSSSEITRTNCVSRAILYYICICHLLQLSGALTIPWWQWFLTRFGKKMAVYIGMTVSFNSSIKCEVELLLAQQD